MISNSLPWIVLQKLYIGLDHPLTMTVFIATTSTARSFSLALEKVVIIWEGDEPCR